MDNVTLFLIGVIFTLAGSGITYVVINSKEHGQFKQALINLEKLLTKLIEDHDNTRDTVNNIKGEHNMMLNARNIIKSHDIEQDRVDTQKGRTG